MPHIVLREITRDNWRATLQLAVHPDQQRFIADYTPIAALVLAKAFIRPDGMVWAPYAIYADTDMIGLVALSYLPDSATDYWVWHFFIDQAQQGQGYGKAALQALIQLVVAQRPHCRQINLTVHPENLRAQHLYTSAGFQPTGQQQFGELVYTLRLRLGS